MAAVMLDRAPRVRSAPGVLLHRDARRIEPDPGSLPLGANPFRSLRLSPWSVFSAFRPSGPAKLQPARQAGAGSRQAVGPAPRSHSDHLAVPIVSLLPDRLPSLAGCLPAVPSGAFTGPAETGPCDAPSGPLRFDQRLRASRNIYGSLGRFRRIRQACFPTLLRASLPLLAV